MLALAYGISILAVQAILGTVHTSDPACKSLKSYYRKDFDDYTKFLLKAREEKETGDKYDDGKLKGFLKADDQNDTLNPSIRKEAKRFATEIGVLAEQTEGKTTKNELTVLLDKSTAENLIAKIIFYYIQLWYLKHLYKQVEKMRTNCEWEEPPHTGIPQVEEEQTGNTGQSKQENKRDIETKDIDKNLIKVKEACKISYKLEVYKKKQESIKAQSNGSSEEQEEDADQDDLQSLINEINKTSFKIEKAGNKKPPESSTDVTKPSLGGITKAVNDQIGKFIDDEQMKGVHEYLGKVNTVLSNKKTT